MVTVVVIVLLVLILGFGVAGGFVAGASLR